MRTNVLVLNLGTNQPCELYPEKSTFCTRTRSHAPHLICTYLHFRRRVAYNRTCDLRFQYANTAKYPHGKSHLLFSRSFRQKRLSRRVHMSTINHVYKFVAYQVCCTFAPILQIGLRDAWLCACMCRMPSTTRRSRRINPCSQQY